jgi:hypothetical protein
MDERTFVRFQESYASSCCLLSLRRLHKIKKATKLTYLIL